MVPLNKVFMCSGIGKHKCMFVHACNYQISSSVTSPLINLLEVGVFSGAAAEASEIRKHNSNDGGDLGWVCIPLVVKTYMYGVWGQEAVKSIAQLASRLAITCSKPKSVITCNLYGRLNTCLVRSVASAILSRIEPL